MKQRSSQNDSADSGGGTSLEKKPYTKPELVEWGSVFDLTQGIFTTTPDFPKGTVGG